MLTKQIFFSNHKQFFTIFKKIMVATFYYFYFSKNFYFSILHVSSVVNEFRHFFLYSTGSEYFFHGQEYSLKIIVKAEGRENGKKELVDRSKLLDLLMQFKPTAMLNLTPSSPIHCKFTCFYK